MDKSTIVAVDESWWSGGSVASAVKPSGSVVRINMITIDLGCAMEEIDSPVHEHFSIRGFVAFMRKKDPKVCLPFALEGHDIPPLDIPRFRLWNCSHCVGDVCAKSTGKNDHGENGLKQIVNGKESKNNQMIIYNLPCDEEETDGMTKYSDIQPDEPVNVSSKGSILDLNEPLAERSSNDQTSCRYRGIPDLNEPLAERSSNDQTSCRYRGIPDLNETLTEIPSNMQGKDFPTPPEIRSSALLILSDACEQIARESKGLMGVEVVPNNSDMNNEVTRPARDMSAAYTQGQMPPHPRKIHLGGSRNRAIQPSRGNVALEVCKLNQNPADFSYPDAVNNFTSSAKDLKPRKRKYRSLNESSLPRER